MLRSEVLQVSLLPLAFMVVELVVSLCVFRSQRREGLSEWRLEARRLGQNLREHSSGPGIPKYTDEANKSRVEPFESSRDPTTPRLVDKDSSDASYNRPLEQPCWGQQEYVPTLPMPHIFLLAPG